MSTQHTFISYSRADAEFALKLASDLRAAGQDIWLDQLDIQPGARWDREVEQALKTCRRMLLILSPASVQSENVQDEIGYAMQKNKLIIPVLHEPCDIPLRLLRLQYVDFTNDYNRGLQRLLPVMKGTDEEVARATGSLTMPEAARKEPPPAVQSEITAATPKPKLSSSFRKGIAIGAGVVVLLILGLLLLPDSEQKPNATQAVASASTPAPSTQPAYTEPLAEVFPCSSEASMKSPGGYDYAPLTVVNKRQEKVALYWLDGNGNRSRKFKYEVEAGKTEKFEDTLVKDHILVITAADGDCLKLVRVPGLVTVE